MTQKKPSGLGRGLGELLDDNAPEIRTNSSAVKVTTHGETIKITPLGSAEKNEKSLYENKHKNRSVKANFTKK